MEKLLDAIAAVVCLISPEKVQAIANRIRCTDASKAAGSLSSVVGTPAAAGIVDQLVEAWRTTTVSAEELASMLLAASHVFTKAAAEQSTELVWTGPTTPYAASRRTEQVMLQVIRSAQHKLFLTSFVAYKIDRIVEALNVASGQGVELKILLELSEDQGGRLSMDSVSVMRRVLPHARFYAWLDKLVEFEGGSVHSKIVLSDDTKAFITSANLTGHAMEKNMEAGVLLSGGRLPRLLDEHLEALVATRVIKEVDLGA